MQPWTRALVSMTCCAFAFGFSGQVCAQDVRPTDVEGQLLTITQPNTAIAQNANATAAALHTASEELPDSPGVIWARSQQAASPQASSATPAQDSSQANSNSTGSEPQSPTQTDASSAPQSATQANSQEEKLQRPVGTAAAAAPPVSGVTAAEPAGVAIAPAKQRRVRTIVLRVGAILGAGAALGTVIALTEATPSKPPGAH